jgi:hypothetical protein
MNGMYAISKLARKLQDLSVTNYFAVKVGETMGYGSQLVFTDGGGVHLILAGGGHDAVGYGPGVVADDETAVAPGEEVHVADAPADDRTAAGHGLFDGQRPGLEIRGDECDVGRAELRRHLRARRRRQR